MEKIIVLTFLLVFMMSAAALQVPAVEETLQTTVVDVGNKFCPISGDPVSGQDFVVYNGKRYGLCCPMCKKPFLADPEKYITAMNVKETASTATPADSKSEAMEKDMEQGDL